MQVFRQIKTDKLARSTMKAMMRYTEMSKVLKMACWGKNALLSGEKEVIAYNKGLWVCTKSSRFFWRTDLFKKGWNSVIFSSRNQ